MRIENRGAHLDQLIRQTRVHHTQLSSMADMKANILLTMSSVVITLSVRSIGDERLRLGTILLIVFCLLTIVLATYVVMPHTSLRSKRRDSDAVKSPGFNLLFFGDFTALSQAEFEEAMEATLSDPDASYQAQVREIYLLGSFLAKKKYRFLRLAYLAFLVGFLASGIAILSS